MLGGCDLGHKQTTQTGYRGAGLDQIVDGSRSGRQQVHRSTKQRARDAVAIKSLQADDNKPALASLGGSPGPIDSAVAASTVLVPVTLTVPLV